MYDPGRHKRRSIRLQDYDYTGEGAYFLTLCAWQRECLFGEIDQEKMLLNDMGRIVADEWRKIGCSRTNIVLDEFIIMPNHFHGIIFIMNNVGTMPAVRPNVTTVEPGRPVGIAPTGPLPGSIGALMAQFKSKVTKRINAFCCNPGHPVWQRNYYERVIRNESELSRVREYICNNPLQWALDTDNPVNYP